MPSEFGDTLNVRNVGGVTVVSFEAGTYLDEATIPRLGEELGRIADGCGRGGLVIDFGNVKVLSSAALGLLIRLHMRLTAAGSRLSIRNLRPEVYGIVEAGGLGGLFGDEPGPEEDPGAGVTARTKPPKPTGGGAVSLPPPAGDE